MGRFDGGRGQGKSNIGNLRSADLDFFSKMQYVHLECLKLSLWIYPDSLEYSNLSTSKNYLKENTTGDMATFKMKELAT